MTMGAGYPFIYESQPLLGVLAGRAGYSLNAFATNCLLLSGGEGIFLWNWKTVKMVQFCKKNCGTLTNSSYLCYWY